MRLGWKRMITTTVETEAEEEEDDDDEEDEEEAEMPPTSTGSQSDKLSPRIGQSEGCGQYANSKLRKKCLPFLKIK